jgi:hypothetical protein
MTKDDKLTLTLPDGSIRTGTIVEVVSHPTEAYYVVEFDNGAKYGYFKSDIEKDESKQRIEKVKKIIGHKFCDRDTRNWALGYINGLYDVHREIVEPITFREWNYLYEYIKGYVE